MPPEGAFTAAQVGEAVLGAGALEDSLCALSPAGRRPRG